MEGRDGGQVVGYSSAFFAPGFHDSHDYHDPIRALVNCHVTIYIVGDRIGGVMAVMEGPRNTRTPCYECMRQQGQEGGSGRNDENEIDPRAGHRARCCH